MDKHILQHKVAALTEQPLTIDIDIRKRTLIDWLLRRPVKKEFEVRPTRLSTLIYFSDLTSRLTDPGETQGKGLPALVASISNDGRLMFRILALLIEDTDKEPSKRLQKLLADNITITDAKILLMQLIEFSSITDFMSTTILIRKMSLLKTKELIAFEEKQITGLPLHR
jgi:hypothetical protein